MMAAESNSKARSGMATSSGVMGIVPYFMTSLAVELAELIIFHKIILIILLLCNEENITHSANLKAGGIPSSGILWAEYFTFGRRFTGISVAGFASSVRWLM